MLAPLICVVPTSVALRQPLAETARFVEGRIIDAAQHLLGDNSTSLMAALRIGPKHLSRYLDARRSAPAGHA